jgi:transcriptional regulator with XRE-family HTH domain
MFGLILKKLREEKRISQVELAKVFKISQGTIGNWETGKRIPNIK